MNSDVNPETTIKQPVEPQIQQDSNQKPTGLIGKILIGSILAVINFIALLVVGYVVWFLVSASQQPNSADIVGLVLVPVGGIALFIVSVIDGVCCLKYLLSKGKSKGKKFAAATVLGICILVCLAVLSFAAVVLYFNFNPSAIR